MKCEAAQMKRLHSKHARGPWL